MNALIVGSSSARVLPSLYIRKFIMERNRMTVFSVGGPLSGRMISVHSYWIGGQ